MKALTTALTFILFLSASPALGNIAKAKKTWKNEPYDKNDVITYELIKSGLDFAAVRFAKRHLFHSKKIDAQFEKALEFLVLRTGTESFNTLKDFLLAKHESPTMGFILAVKLFKKGKYKKALKYLDKVKKDHRLWPEAQLVIGSIHQIKSRFDQANKYYQLCEKGALDTAKDKENEKLSRYFEVLSQTCTMHSARLAYKQGDYKKSLEVYDRIEKTSYRWPYTLLEKAWGNYHVGDFNRALGLLVTYRSPLLASYFIPESEVLIALSYNALCLYDDSLQVIDRFYRIYKPQSDALKTILEKNRRSHTWFLDLIVANKAEEAKSPYVKNLVTQIRKQIKFNLDLSAFNKAKDELKYLLSMDKKDPFVKFMIKEVTRTAAWRERKLNHYVKERMYGFINEIHRLSYEMFNLKLEIMSNKRHLLYRGKKLIADRARGDISNVNRKVDEYFWTFNGEFWADELGDYSFGLKSNCKEVRDVRASL